MNLLNHLAIQIQEQSPEKVILTMPISEKHKQPFGYVHGGINAVLIETACSIGANLHVDKQQFCVGVDLQVSHLSSAQSGTLTVIATPDKIGKTLQVWQASVYLDNDKKTAVGRLSLLCQNKTKQTKNE